MKIKEIQQDLFAVPKDYILVHCISADFKMGAGVAKEFAKRGVKDELKTSVFAVTHCESERVGKCKVTFATDWRAEFNLITKQKYWQKPTYNTLRMALNDMKSNRLPHNKLKFAMPRIGCGLDKLQWDKVKQIIEEVFADTDVHILVCAID